MKDMAMATDIERLQQKHKQRKKQIAAVEVAKSFLHEASKGLSTTRHECDCCGFGLWDDEPEARIHRSMKSALKQTQKVMDMMIDDRDEIYHALRDMMGG